MYLRKTFVNDICVSRHYERTVEELADRLMEDCDEHFLDYVINVYPEKRRIHMEHINDRGGIIELENTSESFYFLNHATHADYVQAFKHVRSSHEDNTYNLFMETTSY